MKFKNTAISTLSAISLTAISLLATPVAFASGSHDDGHGTKKSSIGVAGKLADVDRVIEIKMYDNYYEPEKIQIKKGETIRFKITNAGEYVHEFNIGTSTMHMEHQKEMMMMMEHGVLEADKINHDMMKMDMGGGKTMDHNDPNSVLLEPAKSAEIIWNFTDAAKLEFACNVPGHYDSGMMGDVVFD